MNVDGNSPPAPASQRGLATVATLLLAYSLGWLVGPIAFLVGDAIITDQPTPWPSMILYTSLLGAAGGAVHGLASLSSHVGRGTFLPRWTTFYIARPFAGAGMALITYLVLHSGIGGFNVQSDLLLLAWAALAGLYSQPALDKLRDIFATIFRSEVLQSPSPHPGQSGNGQIDPVTGDPEHRAQERFGSQKAR